MSGSGVGPGPGANVNGFEKLNWSGADVANIQDFSTSSDPFAAQAMKLLSAGVKFQQGIGGGHIGGKEYAPGLTNPQGENLEGVKAAYNAWGEKNRQYKMDKQAYLDKKAKVGEGRDSTIIGFNQEKSATVLGSQMPYGKTTVLG